MAHGRFVVVRFIRDTTVHNPIRMGDMIRYARSCSSFQAYSGSQGLRRDQTPFIYKRFEAAMQIKSDLLLRAVKYISAIISPIP